MESPTRTPTTRAPAPASDAWTPERVLVITCAAAIVASTYALGGTMFLLSPFGAAALLGAVFAAFLAWKPHAWLYLSASVAASILPLLFLGLMTGGHTLLNPLASTEWTASAILAAATLVVIPAGIRGFRQARGRAAARRSILPYAIVLACLVVGGAAASALAGSRAVEEFAGGSYDLAPDVVVELATKHFEFAPIDVAIPRGKLVEIAVKNEDVALHTFTYKVGARTYSHDLLPGATTRFLVKIDEAGEFPLWCKPHADVDAHGHGEGMVGTIRVG